MDLNMSTYMGRATVVVAGFLGDAIPVYLDLTLHCSAYG